MCFLRFSYDFDFVSLKGFGGSPTLLALFGVPFLKGKTMPNFFTGLLGRWCPLGQRSGSAARRAMARRARRAEKNGSGSGSSGSSQIRLKRTSEGPPPS